MEPSKHQSAQYEQRRNHEAKPCAVLLVFEAHVVLAFLRRSFIVTTSYPKSSSIFVDIRFWPNSTMLMYERLTPKC